MTFNAICGSNLRLYDGDIRTMKSGDVLGHKFMGEVVETGSTAARLSKSKTRKAWCLPDITTGFLNSMQRRLLLNHIRRCKKWQTH